MMTTVELSLAILALLATPGPTNTLMFLAGAERGLSRALRLIPAELAGYLITVVPLTLAGTRLLDSVPAARAIVAVLAGLWVAVLAARLWRLPAAQGTAPAVTARTVLVTTVLNPKALVFGLVLLPAPQGVVLNLANFAGQVAVVAVLWVAGGSMLAQGRANGRAIPVIRRIASVWLGALSLVLVARGMGV